MEGVMSGVGIADLSGGADSDGETISFDQQRLLDVLREAGISPELLTPQQMARLREDMILDPTPFDDAGAMMQMLRGIGGFEDALTDADERAAEALAKQKMDELEDEAKGEAGSGVGLAAVAASCIGAGIAFGGEGDPDNLHPECIDGFEMPKVLGVDPMSLGALMNYYKKKSKPSH
jgi:hypothetical protein